MAIQRARGNAGALGDRDHRAPTVAALLDQLPRGRSSRSRVGDDCRAAVLHAGSARSMIAPASTPGGSVPYTRPPSPPEPGGAERVGDGRRGVADEQRALQRERELLDEAAGPELALVHPAPVAWTPPQRARDASRTRARWASSRASPPAASSHSAMNAGSPSGSLTIARRTSSAATLPEPSQIEFERRAAIEQRHPGILDEAVAAETLERLGRVRRGALADPVLHDRGREPPERGLCRGSS